MRARRIVSAGAALCLAGAAFPNRLRGAEAPLLGFSPEASAAQRALESRFDAKLQAENLRAWHKRLAARPHPVGSPYGRENAEFLLGLFRSWGYDARIEQFDVLFPTPRTRVLEMTAPTRWTAGLAEPVLPEDATSGQTAEQLPAYHAYSIDGDVEGELVYVNYGVPADYEVLERHGVDVKGKIVLARYGGSWRGIKPKVAAEHGAVGCLVYSDPRDDGYFQGDVYPKGPWRMAHGAQRGSVADMPLFPGDPLTPGVAATKEAKRLDRKDAPTLTRIPVMPISHADAQPLLAALGGKVVPQAWRGALPLTYHFGPGPARVHLKLEFDWKLAPALDVIAVMKGSERPDEWVIRGNHHDAWVNGAQDPVSGAVAVLEEARVVAELAKAGARPRRTIVYALWDAEEPGLLGSTEWAEAHAEELQRKAVAYVNSDSNARGFLSAGGSMTLEPFVDQVAESVTDPQTKASVKERCARGSRSRARRRTPRRRRSGPACASTRWAPARTTRRSCSTSASRPSTSDSAARTAAAPTIRSSTRSTTTPASWTPPSSTGRPSRSWGAASSCAWRTPRCCPSTPCRSRRAPPGSRARCRSWPTTCASRPRSTTGACARASIRWRTTPGSRWWRPRRGTRFPS